MRLAPHFWPTRLLLVLLRGATSLLCVHHAAAQTPQGWADRPTLTGDWGGLRTQIEQDGITLNSHYASESGALVAGPRLAARYTQQLDLEALFDLNHLAGIHDALVQVTVTYRWGRSLSSDVLHNEFSVQELYGAGQNLRLAELNFQQSLDRHEFEYEIGWSPLGDAFAKLPDFCKFERSDLRSCQRDDHKQRRPQLPDRPMGRAH